MNKLGELTLKFEKDTYRKRLKDFIKVAQDAKEYCSQLKFKEFTEVDHAVTKGYILGLKMAIELLDENQ